MPHVVLRDQLSPAERFWLAPKGYISNEGLVVIACDRMEMDEATGLLCAHYKTAAGQPVVLRLPMHLVLAIADFHQEPNRKPPGFGTGPADQATPAPPLPSQKPPEAPSR